jgi:protein involved in plasmid replication-relaxation
VLTSQIHRHFNPARAITTTQRRLKRLSDAGLVERFQFHRRDGGGVPMCYVASDAGLDVLRAAGRLPAAERQAAGDPASSSARLRRARRDVHAAGWALALTRALADRRVVLRGAAESALTPPMRTDAGRALPLGPSELRLPGGRIPHDFLSTDGSGRRSEVDRFDTLRPHVVIEVAAESPAADESAEERSGAVQEQGASNGGRPAPDSTIDLMVELDDRLPTPRAAGKLERYEHFLAGWSAHTARYGRRMEALPVVVFVCRDRDRARRCARCADPLLRACRSYPGEYPHDWLYEGRSRIVFASERDAHEGLLGAVGVPSLPPDVRVTAAGGDPRAGSVQTLEREILDADRYGPAEPSLDGGR